MPRALGQIDMRKSEAILDAAAEVMAERGLAASIEAVARRAGVSKQTVYNHFGGREEIVRALAERRSDAIVAPLAEPGAAKDPEAALVAFARSLLQSLATPRHVEVLRLAILSAAEHPELAEILFSAGPRATRRRLADFLAQEHAAGRLCVPDPAAAAETFAGMAIGSLQLQGLMRLGAPAEDEIDHRARYAAATFMRAHTTPLPRRGRGRGPPPQAVGG